MRPQTNTLRSLWTPCEVCSKTFHPRSDLLKAGRGTTCGLRCAGVLRRTSKEQVCLVCGHTE
jgi:hypothetical protein